MQSPFHSSLEKCSSGNSFKLLLLFSMQCLVFIWRERKKRRQAYQEHLVQTQLKSLGILPRTRSEQMSPVHLISITMQRYVCNSLGKTR